MDQFFLTELTRELDDEKTQKKSKNNLIKPIDQDYIQKPSGIFHETGLIIGCGCPDPDSFLSLNILFWIMESGSLPPNQYNIWEIFDSIQGEGSWLGIPCTFIRLAGCNLRCDWCDTKNSWGKGTRMTVETIIAHIHLTHIVLTGGEPTIQILEPLITAIRKHGNYQIAIETNGTNSVPKGIDWIVCSPKPASKYQINCQPHELKYVVDDNFTVVVIPKKFHEKIPIWLQPNSVNMEKSMSKAYELAMKFPFLRLGVQLHKIYHVR